MGIAVCKSWRDRCGSATLHPVEIEALHIISTKYAGKTTVCSETIIEDAKSSPETYPRISAMDCQQALWHLSSLLERMGFKRRNRNSKYWSKE